MSLSSRLHLGALIARGGMAEVFAARLLGPAGFEKDVAVKRVLPRHAGDPIFLQRFLAEARLAARLTHPNIVQIFQLGTDGRDHYIVMEAVRGATLRQVLQGLNDRGERMPAATALFIARSLCAGLAHAHEYCDADGQPLEIIHRDISPQNVLLGHDGSVKIIDFGIAHARDRERLTRTGHRIGKPHYMAPEQIAAQPIDVRADLYAVGVLLHEMLTGQRPFSATSDVELMDRICRGERPPVRMFAPDLEEACAALIERALAVGREDRPPSARAFVADLADAAATTGLRADGQDVEALLARLLPKAAQLPWPVDRENLPGAQHTITVSDGRPDSITASSDQPRSSVAADTVVLPSRLQPPLAAPFVRNLRHRLALWTASGLLIVGGALHVGDSLLQVDEDSDTANTVGDAGISEPARIAGGPTDASTFDSDMTFFEDVNLDSVDTMQPDGGLAPSDAVRSRSSVVERERSPRAASQTGRLVVETRPWSEVLLDGRRLGETPLSKLVSVGRHRLILRNREQSLQRALTIVVGANTPTVVRMDLRPDAAPSKP